MTSVLALITAIATLLALALGALVTLRGWRGWLELRREQVLSGDGRGASGDLAELKRRVRKLEAIASGVE